MNRFQKEIVVFAFLFMVPAAGKAAGVDGTRTKEFLVMGYQGITTDLTLGRGAYLATLFDLLHISADEQPAAIEQIRAFSKTHPNIMDFSDQVLARYAPAALILPPVSETTPRGSSPTFLEPLPTGPKIFVGAALPNALAHLGKGMKVTVYLNTGTHVSGSVNDYDAGRLWIRTPEVMSFKLNEIRALEAPDL